MKITRKVAKHPLQPLVKDDQGTVRFKKNKIIDYLWRSGKINLNEIAVLDFPREDQEQLAQLIGYSLSGFGELSYVTDKTYNQGSRIACSLSLKRRHQTMSYRKVNKTVYKCRCEAVNPANGTICGHEWESFTLPDRCAKCKRYTWNGVDKRVKVEPPKRKRARR